MPPETTADAERAAKLRRVLSAFEGRGFAVLDGARFPDLPKLCRRERLFARSLFLDHADVEVEKAGPWLLGLGQAPDALDRVLALVGEEPAAVFWCCAGGEAVLYRHLRRLNMARIPAWATSRLARASRRSSAALSTCRVIAITHARLTPARLKANRKPSPESSGATISGVW